MKHMQYQWDNRKAAVNLRKHSVDFADAVAVFEDDAALIAPDDEHDEERFVAAGQDTLGRVLVVVFTHRGDQIIRIISARRATARERREYEAGR